MRELAKGLIAQGIDPRVKREEEKQNNIVNTFESVARSWHSGSTGHPHWKEITATKIIRSLECHIFPYLGSKGITEIKTNDLTPPLREMTGKGFYASAIRLIPIMASIFRYAVQEGICTYNPALDLKGVIQPIKTQHRPALTFERIPELLTRINNHDKGRRLTQLAVLLTITVFVRSSELRFARWCEVDLNLAQWVIPGEREKLKDVKNAERGAKMGNPHIVPLSRQALALLNEIRELSGQHDFIFPGDHNPYKPMSENTINKALRNMGYDTKTEICGHGFRSLACSALTESRLWSKEAVERQMSHIERNEVRGAYTHLAEHMEERCLMMQWWADYLDANREKYITPFEFAKNNK